MKRRPLGLFLLAAGTAIEIIALAIEVWQEQDVYTISSAITFPAFLAMIVAIVPIARGYRLFSETLPPRGQVLAVAIGSVVGWALWGGALWWQVAVGLPSGDNSDLLSYAAGVVLIAGASIVAQGISFYAIGSLDRPIDGSRANLSSGQSEKGAGSDQTHRRWAAVLLLGGGAALIGITIGSIGWVSNSSGANYLYFLLSLEIGLSGAVFVLVGYSGSVQSIGAGALRTVRTGGIVAGGALVIGGTVWWWLSSIGTGMRVIDSLILLLIGAGIPCLFLLLTGIGLVILSVRLPARDTTVRTRNAG